MGLRIVAFCAMRLLSKDVNRIQRSTVAQFIGCGVRGGLVRTPTPLLRGKDHEQNEAPEYRALGNKSSVQVFIAGSTVCLSVRYFPVSISLLRFAEHLNNSCF